MNAVSRVEVARVADEHMPALAEFYRQVWDPEATPESVREARADAAARNPVTPGEPPPTWLLLQDGRAIAHVTTIPIAVWVDGVERPGHWIKGLWVLPEFQRSSAGFLVLRAAVAELELMLALVHEPAAIRLFQALKFNDLGALPNAIRVLDAGALLARLDLDALGLRGLPGWLRATAGIITRAASVVGPIIGGASRLLAAVMTGPVGQHSSDVTSRLDRDEADTLWQAARAGIGAAPARGGRDLDWSFSRDPGYVFVNVRSRGRLVGLGVLKRPRGDGDPRLRGVRVATLSVILYHPGEPRSGLAVLRAAEAAARSMGADALLCSATAASTGALLRRRVYLPLPNNLHVLARVPAEHVATPAGISDWWFNRGDSGADGSF